MSKLRKIKTLLVEGCSNLFKTSAHETRTMEVVPRSPQSSWLLLPRSIVQLTLARNDLYNESFPMDFSSLSSLVALDLSGNPMDSLPDSVRSLVRIESLCMRLCKNLKSVLNLPGTIISLDVCGCKSLEKITLHPARSELPSIASLLCFELKEVQGLFKFEPIKKFGKEITDRLGWSGLRLLEHQEVITNDNTLSSPLMLYEFGIFTVSLLDNQVPEWFTYKTNGSSISFTVPPSPNNHRIRGLNVCFVQTVSDFIKARSASATKINNKIKNLTWIYKNNWQMEQRNGERVLMSHWIFENNELEVGDEVYVAIGESDKHCLNIKECGIDLVYDEHNNELQETETDPLDYYKSWKYDFGGYLSPFQYTDGSSLLSGGMSESYVKIPDYISRLFSNRPELEDVRWKEFVTESAYQVSDPF